MVDVSSVPYYPYFFHRISKYDKVLSFMKIITHNTYWFQGSPSRWGTEKIAAVPEVLDRLIYLYASVKPDIICLQEVHTEEIVKKISSSLSMNSWIYAPGGIFPEYGGCLLSTQNISLQDLSRHNGNPEHERVHLRAQISTPKGPLILAAIHLPSNRFTPSKEEGEKKRIEELKKILHDSSRPDIVVGDMNAVEGSKPYRFMKESGYSEAAEITGIPAKERHVDYMWIDDTIKDRVVSFQVIHQGNFLQKTPAGEIWQLSDHPPLIMEVI